MSEPSIRSLAERSAAASRALLALTPRSKRALLGAVAEAIEARHAAILAANAADLADARAHGRPAGFVERLEISPARLNAIVRAFRTIADLNDPIGEQINRWIRPNGLEIVRVRVPIGVVGVAFESRPQVVPNAAALCLKLGNALLLAGDLDARRTSAALLQAIQEGATPKGLPPDAVQAVFTDDPAVFRELARMQGLVDLLIPRGSIAFVADLVDHATVPVLKHLGGYCTLYVDEGARIDMALEILRDARCHEPYACNSVGRVLLHPAAAPAFLVELGRRSFCRRVKLTLDEASRALLDPEALPPPAPEAGQDPAAAAPEAAAELPLDIGVVRDLEDAIGRINTQGSHVADAIVTEDDERSNRFLREVDSACVCVNASPRFADGGEFGMGAEIGFSTDKLHARGPLGLEELTSTKYRVRGKGQTRES